MLCLFHLRGTICRNVPTPEESLPLTRADCLTDSVIPRLYFLLSLHHVHVFLYLAEHVEYVYNSYSYTLSTSFIICIISGSVSVD